MKPEPLISVSSGDQHADGQSSMPGRVLQADGRDQPREISPAALLALVQGEHDDVPRWHSVMLNGRLEIPACGIARANRAQPRTEQCSKRKRLNAMCGRPASPARANPIPGRPASAVHRVLICHGRTGLAGRRRADMPY